MTNLLLVARTQHLRNTLEELPIGTITVNRLGVITSVDTWTEKTLMFSRSELLKNSITVLFENAAFDFMELLRTRYLGYVGSVELRTRAGDVMAAKMVLAPGPSVHVMVLHLIYSLAAEENAA